MRDGMRVEVSGEGDFSVESENAWLVTAHLGDPPSRTSVRVEHFAGDKLVVHVNGRVAWPQDPQEPLSREQLMAAVYEVVRRRVDDGSVSEATKVHSQACGVVAYVFDVRPDDVARAVLEESRR